MSCLSFPFLFSLLYFSSFSLFLITSYYTNLHSIFINLSVKAVVLDGRSGVHSPVPISLNIDFISLPSSRPSPYIPTTNSNAQSNMAMDNHTPTPLMDDGNSINGSHGSLTPTISTPSIARSQTPLGMRLSSVGFNDLASSDKLTA
jgi:hypothetical protein